MGYLIDCQMKVGRRGDGNLDWDFNFVLSIVRPKLRLSNSCSL